MLTALLPKRRRGAKRGQGGQGGAPVGLHEDSWAQVLVRVPPVARAGGGAAGAEDALVEAVDLGAVLHRLEVLDALHGLPALLLDEGLDRLVLRVEVAHVHHEVFHDKHMGQRGHLGGARHLGNLAEAGEGVLAVDVHGAGAADTLPDRDKAAAQEGEGRCCHAMAQQGTFAGQPSSAAG